jgi:hypothetical protein
VNASGDAGGERSPLDRAVDLLVYAPLGLAIAARDELPRLIARGRKEAEGQVGMARIVGQFAVDRGQKEAGKLLRQATERLAGLGLVPDPSRTAPPASAPAEPTAAPSPPPTPEPPAPPPAPAAGALAIPGYDALSAPQVVQRLDGLSDDELEAVRAYEAGTRGRKTILSRIAQLQSSP